MHATCLRLTVLQYVAFKCCDCLQATAWKCWINNFVVTVLKCWDCLAGVLWSRQFNTDLHAEMTSFQNFETGQLWNAILPLKDVSSKINLEKVNIKTFSTFYPLAQVQLEMYTTPWLLSSCNLDYPERERESRGSVMFQRTWVFPEI